MKMFIIQKADGLYGLSELYVVVNEEIANKYKESIVPDEMSVIDVMRNIPKAEEIKGYSGYESFYGTKIFGVFEELRIAREYVRDFKDYEPKTVYCVINNPYAPFAQRTTCMPEHLFNKWIKKAYYPLRDQNCMEAYYIPETNKYYQKTYSNSKEPCSKTYDAYNKWHTEKLPKGHSFISKEAAEREVQRIKNNI